MKLRWMFASDVIIAGLFSGWAVATLPTEMGNYGWAGQVGAVVAGIYLAVRLYHLFEIEAFAYRAHERMAEVVKNLRDITKKAVGLSPHTTKIARQIDIEADRLDQILKQADIKAATHVSIQEKSDDE